MQKNKQASILIWAFFLTLLMSFSFIFIQFQIKSSLSTNSKKLKNLELEKQKQEFLWDINSKTQKIWENNLEIKDFSSLEYSLKKDEEFELEFTEIWTINLELLNSWIISYALNSGNFWENILPTYNTGTTSKTIEILSTPTILKIKNFSWYSKIRIWASKKVTHKLGNLPKTEVFEKAWKITLSLYKNCKIEYKINWWTEILLVSWSSQKYTNKSFFVKSWDSIFFERIYWNISRKIIISWDYNLSDMLKNNSYKISKTTWWKEIVLEKWKIK